MVIGKVAPKAGKPLVWHIYPQDDNALHDKLAAFLDWLQAPDSHGGFINKASPNFFLMGLMMGMK